MKRVFYRPEECISFGLERECSGRSEHDFWGLVSPGHIAAQWAVNNDEFLIQFQDGSVVRFARYDKNEIEVDAMFIDPDDEDVLIDCFNTQWAQLACVDGKRVPVTLNDRPLTEVTGN